MARLRSIANAERSRHGELGKFVEFPIFRRHAGLMTDRILILDFGSQVTQLIARRLREANVYCEIMPFDKSDAAVRDFAPNGIILSGGPASVTVAGTPRAPQAVFDLGVPLLGICYGQLTLCAQLGGAVESSDHREFGRAHVEVNADSPILKGIWKPGEKHQVWMSHGDKVTELAPGFRIVAASEATDAAAKSQNFPASLPPSTKIAASVRPRSSRSEARCSFREDSISSASACAALAAASANRGPGTQKKWHVTSKFRCQFG